MKKRKVVVIGGGISGLAAAHRLLEANREAELGLEVVVLERGSRLGGVISSMREESFVMEGGADAFLTEKPWALDLCRRLGLENELIGTHSANRRSFILQDGRLKKIPAGFYLMAPVDALRFVASDLLSWPGKVRMLSEFFIPPRRARADESVASFARRRFGREAFEKIVEPMAAGIYSADAEQLSMAAAFPKFAALEQQDGSVLKGLRRMRADGAVSAASGPRYGLFVTPRTGMERLVEALRADMEELEVITEFPVSRLEKSASWKIHGKNGACLEADALCLALPAFEAARLLEGIDRVLAAELNAISYESAVTVNLAYRNIPNVKGFGYVVPPREKRPLLGCTFTSQKFEGRAPEGTTLVRAFLGGPSLREVMRESDADILERIQAELRFTLGIKTGPILARVTRLPRAMPQYHVGHAVRVAAIRRLAASHAGLFLAGNAYEGVGIPDCIRVGEEQAVHLLRFLEGLSSPRDTRVRVGS